MTDFILRLFVKDYENKSNPAVRAKCGGAVAIIGIIVNLFLAAFKLFAGILSGSISITADAVNNISDAGSQVVSLITFKISAKPADRDHPFGYARIEYVASMIVSFLILHVGFDLVAGSIDKLIHPEPPSVDKWVITACVLGASVLCKLWLGVFNGSIAKKINSSVMKATATDSLSDALSTLAVMIGLFLYILFDWYWMDAVMGLVVSVLILWAGIKILNDTKNAILGERPTDEVVRGINDIVAQYPEALGIHDMVVHNYGVSRTIASLHIEVDGKGDIYKLHDTIDNIERRLVRELGIEATIHMDPIVTDDERVSRLRAVAAQTVSGIDERLHIHDFRCVIGHTHTNLIFDIATPFELEMSDAQLCDTVCAKLKALDSTLFAVITVDRE